jgi:hypothetical protein
MAVVTVWLYERGNGEIRSETFTLASLHRGVSAEAKVDLKLARDAVR